MGTVVAFGIWVVELVLVLALILVTSPTRDILSIAFGIWVMELAMAMALPFAIGLPIDAFSKACQHRVLPFHRSLNLLASGLSFIPFGVTVLVGFFRFLPIPPEPPPPDPDFWIIPLVMDVGFGLVSWLVMLAGRKFSRVGARAHARRLHAQVRERIEAGEPEFVCEVMVRDPAATAEDMRRCRAYIESQAEIVDRRMAFSSFIHQSRRGWVEWKAWNPHEVGLSPFWDSTVTLAMVRHDQEWFLRAFFESLLLYWPERPHREVEVLHQVLSHLSRASGWSPAAIEQLRPDLLPKLLRLLEPRPDASFEHLHPEAVEGSRALLLALLEKGPPAPPPVPVLTSAPPPDAIGVVRRGERGDLEFWMRATATEGNIGDVYFRHMPGTPDHKRWWKALGRLEKGQVRPVPPWKAARSRE